MSEQPVTLDVDEIVVHGVELANPGAFGDAVERRLAQLLRERGLPAAPGRDAPPQAPAPVRMTSPHDIGALADGVADRIWSQLAPPAEPTQNERTA